MNKIPFFNFRFQKLKALNLIGYLYHADNVVRKHILVIILFPLQFQFTWDFSQKRIEHLEGIKKDSRMKFIKKSYNAAGK